MAPERIETPRLVLRPVAPGDAPAIHEALADWQVVKWLAPVPWPYTIEDAVAFTARAGPGGSLAAEGERILALTARGRDRLLGVVGLGTGEGQEFGYWLASDVWGQGLVSEAGRAILDAHFAAGGPAVRSGFFDGNERSERVLLRLGFRPDGEEMRGCLARGEDVLSHRMRLDPPA